MHFLVKTINQEEVHVSKVGSIGIKWYSQIMNADYATNNNQYANNRFVIACTFHNPHRLLVIFQYTVMQNLVIFQYTVMQSLVITLHTRSKIPLAFLVHFALTQPLRKNKQTNKHSHSTDTCLTPDSLLPPPLSLSLSFVLFHKE